MNTNLEFQNAGRLLNCIDAVRNIRALLLLVGALISAGVLMGLAGVLGVKVHSALGFVFGLIAIVVGFYGANAVGIMLMDEAKGGISRPVLSAFLTSLGTAHRLILVMLLVAVIYLLGIAGLALLLFLCKIPGVGPLLFTVLFPVSVVIAGVALFAMYFVIFPLAAPAVWEGATTMQAVSRLLAISRSRIVKVLMMMLVLFLITGAVGGFIAGILFSGTLVTSGLSAAIVTPSMGAMGMGGFMRLMEGGLGGGGYLAAGAIGGGVVWMLGLTLPLMVYSRGCCQVYLQNVQEVDVDAVESDLRNKMDGARKRAEMIKAQGAAMAAQSTQANVGAKAPAAESPTAPTTASAETGSAALKCPSCGADCLQGDKFCGACGHRFS